MLTHVSVSNGETKVGGHASNVRRTNVGAVDETDGVHEASGDDQLRGYQRQCMTTWSHGDAYTPVDAMDEVAVGFGGDVVDS